jgi:2,4-dienoyl-CoA reductase-like NADH-dependent reductase (Old Yellow Enzyme family)
MGMKVPSPRALFESVNVGGLSLRNRVVMAPMTRSFSPGGVPCEAVAEYYARRARADVGLIVTEGIFIDHAASGYSPLIPVLHSHDAQSSWRQIVEGVHAAGSCIVPQLWHVGAQAVPGDVPKPGFPPISASGLLGPGQPIGKAMTDADIAAVIDSFGRSAEAALALGFDGVELHAGHGYLIDSFFWGETNRRQDGYGGNAAARATFAAEIVSECRRRTKPDFPILLRFSQWKNADYSAKIVQTPDELEQFLTPLVDAGVDIFHCSTRRFWEPEFSNSDLNLAGWTRKLSGRPTITVGSVGLSEDLFASLKTENVAHVDDLTLLLTMLERGDFDLVAIGRGLLADPDWASKVREGRAGDLRGFHKNLLATLD